MWSFRVVAGAACGITKHSPAVAAAVRGVLVCWHQPTSRPTTYATCVFHFPARSCCGLGLQGGEMLRQRQRILAPEPFHHQMPQLQLLHSRFDAADNSSICSVPFDWQFMVFSVLASRLAAYYARNVDGSGNRTPRTAYDVSTTYASFADVGRWR